MTQGNVGLSSYASGVSNLSVIVYVRSMTLGLLEVVTVL